MEKDIFKFEDFLTGDKMENLKKMKSDLLKEGLFNENELEYSFDDEHVDQNFNPYNTEIDFDSAENTGIKESETIEEFETYEEESTEDDSYVLYKDKAEEFVCDIAIEGVSQKDTEVRLIVESSDWTLMFKGEINNGKCIIPLRKLAILNEGQRGNIKLEVNADGNLFTPWEDEFIVKVSKKVTVNINESKKESGVRVNVKKKKRL
jgi:hypothetical protein